MSLRDLAAIQEELSTIYSDDGVGLQPVDEMQVQQPVLYPRAPLEVGAVKKFCAQAQTSTA
eukprot:6478467-Amphidinium_carterae.1